MSNEQQQIIDEVYRRFCKETFAKNSNLPIIFATDGVSMKDRFIDKCKTDPEFSEKWGLKIEEREVLEQVDQTNPILKGSTTLYPRKLITLTYNNEKIENYE